MTDYYVGPAITTGNGSGTEGDPWHFEDCFDGTNSISAGDRVIFLDGTFVSEKEVTSGFTWHKIYDVDSLAGTVGNPIHLMPADGAHVRINGQFNLVTGSSYIHIHDFEFFNDTAEPGSISAGSAPSELTDWGYVGVAVNDAPGCEVYNNVINGGREGLGIWAGATGCKVYGNIVFEYGWDGADRPHDHAIYTQNEGPTVREYKHNIFGPGKYATSANGHYAVHAYTTASKIKAMSFIENLILGACLGKDENEGMDNITLTDNIISSMRVGSTSILDGNGVTWGKSTESDGTITFTDNTLLNSVVRVINNVWTTPTMTGVQMFKTTSTWGQVDEGKFPAQAYDELATFTDVSSGSGSDQTKLWVNEYDSDRATLVICDLDGDGEVDVATALGTFLTVGETYRIQHFRDLWGTPVVASGEWDGTLSLDVTEEIGVDGVNETGPVDGFIVFREAEADPGGGGGGGGGGSGRLSDEAKTLLESGLARPRIFLKLNFDSGVERYWTGGYDATFFGEEWIAVPHSIIGYSGIESSQDLRANGVEISMIGVPTDAIGGTLTAANYKGKSAELKRALLDTNDSVVWHRTAYFFIDTLDYDLNPETASATVGLETEMRYLGRTLVRRYTDQDQKREFSGDRAFEFVAYLNSGVNVRWGEAGTFFK